MTKIMKCWNHQRRQSQHVCHQFSRLQNMHNRLFLSFTEWTHFPIRCSENHNNTNAEKSENPRFEIWYSVVAPSGGAEKNLNMFAQLHYHPLKAPPKKKNWKLHGLIDFRCAQTSALPCGFSTTGTNLKVFRGTLYRASEISLYGCTSTIYKVKLYGRISLSSCF